jgi:putative transposase
LDECAEKYRGFCKKYKPKPKPEKRNHWGSKLLAGMKITKKGKKAPRGQLSLWEEWEANSPEIIEVADQFIFANCYNPQVAGSILQKNRASG